ncbi:unnamed protein product [Leishmania donovani]|nr:uncharacterized protein LDBPK_073400 [Leishmania donovani]CBZ36733.1 unnamed protein product [Leishmania donovani]
MLRKMSGIPESAELINNVTNLVTGLYGPDSSEWHIIASILRKHLEG